MAQVRGGMEIVVQSFRRGIGKSVGTRTHTFGKNMQPFETVICASPKDFSKVRYVIQTIEKNVPTSGIRVITPSPLDMPDISSGVTIPVHIYADSDVIDFDRSLFSVRPNWVMQMFLKIFQNVTETDWFFVVDADLFFNKPVSPFDNGKPLFLLSLDQTKKNTEPYFRFSREMMGVDRVYHRTFVAETVLYHKQLVRKMISDAGLPSAMSFMKKSAEIIRKGCYPAESELYASYVWSRHPGVYGVKPLSVWHGGIYDRAYEEVEIIDRMAEASRHPWDVYTMHTWETKPWSSTE